jgi:hypothetical protein
MAAWVVIMGILAVIAFFFGAGAMIGAPAVTQQIAGLLMFVVSAVLFVGAVLVGMAIGIRRDLAGRSGHAEPARRAASAQSDARVPGTGWQNCPHCGQLIRREPNDTICNLCGMDLPELPKTT